MKQYATIKEKYLRKTHRLTTAETAPLRSGPTCPSARLSRFLRQRKCKAGAKTAPAIQPDKFVSAQCDKRNTLPL